MLTLDTRTVKAWSDRRVTVGTYESADDVDILRLMVTVLALIDP